MLIFTNYVYVMDKMKFVKYFCQILFCSAIMAIWNLTNLPQKCDFFINVNFRVIYIWLKWKLGGLISYGNETKEQFLSVCGNLEIMAQNHKNWIKVPSLA